VHSGLLQTFPLASAGTPLADAGGALDRLGAAVLFSLGSRRDVVKIATANDFADDVVRVGGYGRERHGFRRCAFDADLLVDDFQIVRACLELACGHLENLIASIDGCESRGGAGNQDAPTADGAGVPRAGVGIDIDDGNILHRHAELLSDNHWNTETGDGAHVDLADVHGHRAVFVDFYDGAAPGTGALDPGAGGESNALVLFQLDFAPADFFGGDLDRLAQRNIAQLGHADYLGAGLRHIVQAEFHWVHAELGGDGIHV